MTSLEGDELVRVRFCSCVTRIQGVEFLYHLAKEGSLSACSLTVNVFCEHLMRVKVMHSCCHPPGLYCGDVSLGLFMQYDCLQHQNENLKKILQLQASSSSSFSEGLLLPQGELLLVQ